MSLIQLIKASFFNFKQLKQAREVGFGKIIGYLILLSAILTIPIITQIVHVMQEFQADGQEIAQKIPPFHIKEGKLTPDKEAEGFIYQTDSIIFTFDPEGKRQAEDISDDLVGNFLSIGLLPEALVLALPASELTSSMLGGNQLVLHYQDNQLASLTDQTVRDVLGNSHTAWWVFLIVFVIALYPVFISLIFPVLLGALFGVIYSRFKQQRYSFLDSIKIVTLTLTVPVLLTTIVQLFTLSFDATTFLLLASFVLFPQVLRKEDDSH